MQFYNNMSISKKLVCLVALCAFFLSLVGYVGYHYLWNSDKAIGDMYNNKLISLQLMNENRVHQRVVQMEMLELMLTTDDNEKKSLLKGMQERIEAYTHNIAELEKIKLDNSQHKMMSEISDLLKKYRNEREVVLNLAMQNKNVEAYQLYTKNVRPIAELLNNRVKELAEYTRKEASDVEEKNKKELAESEMILIGLVLFSLCLIILLGWKITQLIIKPLSQVVVTSREVAAGNLAVGKIKIGAEDEIGQVAKAINEMVSSLQGLIKKVSNSAEQVAAASEELTVTAEQSAQAANQVAATITDVAGGAEKQLKLIGNASTTVEQFSASIQQVVANNSTVANTSARAAGTAKEGLGAVETAVNQMSSIEKTVNNSAVVVTKLGERSKEIGQIVDTISGIAGQTNLLALNAAIEAARAGEQGRGFAVVAEEVRKLAEQSQEAAKQIAVLINEIQTETDKAVIAMNEGTKEVRRGDEVVNIAGQSFKQIATLIGDLTMQGQEIANGVQQMEIGSREIVFSMKEIDTISKNTTEQTQTVSAATEEQSASMEEIASSSESLAQMAQELQQAVSKFRV
ncbi:methyl-accepting chemotaxis protein [Pelosinus sp. sgz500959]|uniref:methyl-accepting chemotaxis protein n=1 Tax=Pelosinus sp. sgz500959 TaxID=3242472 RepID=UPI00367084D6